MIFKGELLLNIAIQIIVILIGCSMSKEKRNKLFYLNWILAIANNCFHLIILKLLLAGDIGPDDKEVFTRETVTLIILTSFIVVCFVLKIMHRKVKVVLALDVIMIAFTTYYFTAIDSWKFAIVLMEVNAFPLLVDIICEVKLRKVREMNNIS